VLGVLWPRLDGRRVLLAVSGGVAAYKAAELCRLLTRCGAEVQVMMTAAAQRFVGADTFAALSGRAVATDLFDQWQEQQIGHIRLAEWAEVLVAAPATADLLARFSAGMADDLVTTVQLAYQGKLLLAPAMNVQMWQHPATQENVARLRSRGAQMVGPESGEMACGHVGAGRMSEPETILQGIAGCLTPSDLAGRAVLVSAGPTHEALDPVRYLSNRSSGKMGFALAAEAAARGARVTLVAGPTRLPVPLGVELVRVVDAAAMVEAIVTRMAGQDVIVMAAAVADYRPKEVAAGKLKKDRLGQRPELALERTVDILSELARRRAEVQYSKAPVGQPLLVGFAAETGPDDLAAAPAKLFAKGCDLALVNDVSQPDAGFDADTNRVVIHHGPRSAPEPLPLLSKREVAARLWKSVVRRLAQERSIDA
jgi:phosphopantothenoylcysteine decarboxylase/phosphopantothenate--cysteine ligase